MKISLTYAPQLIVEKEVAAAGSPPQDIFNRGGSFDAMPVLKIDGREGELVQSIQIHVDAVTQLPTVHMSFIPRELEVELEQPQLTTDLDKLADMLARLSLYLTKAPALSAMPGWERLRQSVSHLTMVLAGDPLKL